MFLLRAPTKALLLRHGAKVTPQRRSLGAFPSDMKIKKNIYIEEWNGKREITERSFQMDFGTVPILFMTLFVLPYFTYAASRAEIQNLDRRFKEVC